MKPHCNLSIAAAVGWMVLILANPAQAQFEELLRHLPESANAIVLVNIKKLLDSPMARQEGWRDDPAKLFAAGLISVPAGVDQLLLAAQVDFRSMQPVWEVALVGMDSAPSLPAIAKQYGGMADTVVGAPALRLPDDTYLVRFSDKCLGGLTPGNRQAVAQWVRGSGRRVSPYLQEAAGYARAGTEIIMALDMADVAALSDVHQAIATVGEALEGGVKPDLKALAGLLQSTRGVMLGVKFNKQAFGKIKLDLAADASLLSVVAKPLFLAMVARRGVMIDEFQNWKVAVEGNRVMFGGYLNSSGLTRLSSMLDLPTPALCTLHETQLSLNRQQTAGKTPTDTAAKIPAQNPLGRQQRPRRNKSIEGGRRWPNDSSDPSPPGFQIAGTKPNCDYLSRRRSFRSRLAGNGRVSKLRPVERRSHPAILPCDGPPHQGRARTRARFEDLWSGCPVVRELRPQDRSSSTLTGRRPNAGLWRLCGEQLSQNVDGDQKFEHPCPCGGSHGRQPRREHDG